MLANTGFKPAIKKITAADISKPSNATDDDKKSTEKKNEEETNKKTETEEKASADKVISDLKFTNPSRWDAAEPGKPVSIEEAISKYGFAKPGDASAGQASANPSNPNSTNGSPNGTGTVINNYPNGYPRNGSGPYANNGGWGSSGATGSGPWSNPGHSGGGYGGRPPSIDRFLARSQDRGVISDLNLRYEAGHVDGSFKVPPSTSPQQLAYLEQKLSHQFGSEITCKDGSCTFTGKGHTVDTPQPKSLHQEELMLSSNEDPKDSKLNEVKQVEETSNPQDQDLKEATKDSDQELNRDNVA